MTLAERLRVALDHVHQPELLPGDHPGARIGSARMPAAVLVAVTDRPEPGLTLIGEADRYVTVTGFEVIPVVGVIPPDLDYHPNEAEVADVFEVPLAFVLDPANQIRASADWQGRTRYFYEIRWGDRRIWGATAAMLVNLSRRLRWAA
ncbi:MAG: CoA pyrophosphatase [Sphingomonadales bacterium]|nr:CoA pyrophosphatase [Sphingomonadales bacterium]